MTGLDGPVEISVATNRVTKVGTSVSLRITQQSDRGERVILAGSVGTDGRPLAARWTLKRHKRGLTPFVTFS